MTEQELYEQTRAALAPFVESGQKALAALQADMVDSTSDDRTTNNSVRHQYRVLNDLEKQQMMELKDIGLKFINYLDALGSSRELALAKTNMQQAVFWAVNHVTG